MEAAKTPDISDLNIQTYDGWMAAVNRLLAGKPDWTALVDSHYFVVVVDGCVSALYREQDVNHIYTRDDLSDYDSSAWGSEVDESGELVDGKCWDGSTPEETAATVLNPVYTTIKNASSYAGWCACAVELLQDKPAGTALKDCEEGFTCLIEGQLFAIPANAEGSTVFECTDGVPDAAVQVEESAWNGDSWDGMDCDGTARIVTQPQFVTLTFVEA